MHHANQKFFKTGLVIKYSKLKLYRTVETISLWEENFKNIKRNGIHPNVILIS